MVEKEDNQTTMKIGRNGKIELLRVISMVQILILHYLLLGGVLDKLSIKDGVKYYIAWLLEAFSYVAVNVFVIISGYYLSQKKEIKLGKVLFYNVGFIP